MNGFSIVHFSRLVAASTLFLLVGCSWHARADNQEARANTEVLAAESVSPKSLLPDEGAFVAVSPNGAEAVLRSLADRRPHQVFALLTILMDPDSVESSTYITPLHESGLDAQMPAGVSPDHAHRLIDHAYTEDDTWAGVSEMLAIFEAMGNEMADMNDGALYTHVSFQPARAGRAGRLTLNTYTEAVCEVADGRQRAKLHGSTMIEYRVEEFHPDFSSGGRQLDMIRLETLHLQDDDSQ